MNAQSDVRNISEVFFMCKIKLSVERRVLEIQRPTAKQADPRQLSVQSKYLFLDPPSDRPITLLGVKSTMPIDVVCSGCSKHFVAPDEHAGRKARCKACGTVTAIPKPDPAPENVPSGVSSVLDRLDLSDDEFEDGSTEFDAAAYGGTTQHAAAALFDPPSPDAGTSRSSPPPPPVPRPGATRAIASTTEKEPEFYGFLLFFSRFLALCGILQLACVIPWILYKTSPSTDSEARSPVALDFVGEFLISLGFTFGTLASAALIRLAVDIGRTLRAIRSGLAALQR